MTDDNIREAAIEAGIIAFIRMTALLDDEDPDVAESEWPKTKAKDRAKVMAVGRAFADAYERAMWRPMDEAPARVCILVEHQNGDLMAGQGVSGGGGEGLFGVTGTGRVVFYSDLAHFRPLPKPPEQKP